MTILDRILLLATGLVALYLVYFFLRNNNPGTKRPTHNIYYAISFAVLLVSGLLLILLTYDVLANPLVVVVAALIPLTLALGLVAQYYPKYELGYLIYVIIGLLAITVTRLFGVGSDGAATVILATVHSIAGLTIFFIPILVYREKRVNGSFICVTVGGTLIGVGGISLAFLKAGSPILSEALIFAILAPILLLMAVSYAWGFIKGTPAAVATNSKKVNM